MTHDSCVDERLDGLAELMLPEVSTLSPKAPGYVVHLVNLVYDASNSCIGFPILLEMKAENFNGLLSWDVSAIYVEVHEVFICFGFLACIIGKNDILGYVG